MDLTEKTADLDIAQEPSPSWRHPVRASTRALWREGRRLPGYSLYDFIHGYVYARWPYIYIGTGTGEHPLHKVISPLARLFARLFGRGQSEGNGSSFADDYHGKVMPLEEATRLVMVNEPIIVEDLERVIPYDQARSIILRNPDHLVALECPCRASRQHPCLPLDVCLIVGEPFASFILDHHPGRSRAIDRDEAAAILAAEHDRGHVHHAFFKDAMLGRFYAICNCCACCCGAMQAFRNGTPMLAASGYVTQIDEVLCIGCGDCVETCQFGALSLEDDVAVVDVVACMGCGVCTSVCQQDAHQLVRDPAKGEPLIVEAVLAQSRARALQPSPEPRGDNRQGEPP